MTIVFLICLLKTLWNCSNFYWWSF